MNPRPKTIFCDIDGVLLKHSGDICQQHLNKAEVLPGVPESIRDWDIKGYRIILVTGRRESTREFTEKQLAEAGILYDQLVMGVTGGVRVIINDHKPNSNDPTCEAVNIQRNQGLSGVQL
jgi:ribonucleotide monophosphatase NagD (HAD superfamily)